MPEGLIRKTTHRKATLGSLIESLVGLLEEHPQYGEYKLLVEHDHHFDTVRSCEVIIMTTEDEQEFGVLINFSPPVEAADSAVVH